jgi:uncharacterized membrane protein YheB (UPF0754 family)
MRPKQQFCPKGHDKDITGRTTDGHCRECTNERRRKYNKGEKPKKLFCKRGHEIAVVGRYPSGGCIGCSQERKRDKDIIREQRKEYRSRNKEKLKLKKKQFYDANRDVILEQKKVYEQNNREKINASQVRRRKENINFKLASYLRFRINSAIKSGQKTGSAVRDLGCTIPFLKDCIAAQFHDGMTWDNWGEVWELDHIKELWEFDLSDKEQFKQAVHYTNMQPLTVEDHRKKTANGMTRRCLKKSEAKK